MFFLRRVTQCEKIIAYIQKHGSITHKEAELFGCMRLASRICDLKKRGYIIRTKMVRVKNKDGSYTSIASYSFADVEKGA